MSKYKAVQRNQHLLERPVSEKLKEIHVYKVPRDKWLEKRKLAKNQVVDFTISLGFIRVMPEITLIDLRNEIIQQLKDELLPDNFIFLKSVGRHFTQVKPNQELELKVKYFSPPIAKQPEVYLLEGGYVSRMNSSVETSEGEEFIRLKQYGKNSYKSHRSMRNSSVTAEKVQKGLPRITKKVATQRKNNAKNVESSGKQVETITTTRTMVVTTAAANDEEENVKGAANQFNEEADSALAETNAESWIDASSANEMNAQATTTTKRTKQILRTKGRTSNTRAARPIRTKRSIYSKNKTGVTRVSKNKTTKPKTADATDDSHRSDEQITVEEKIEMLMTKGSDEEDLKDLKNHLEILNHEQVIEDDNHEDEASADGSAKLKIDVNAELINGVSDGKEVAIALTDDYSERDALLQTLMAVRQERQQAEKQREALINTYKGLQMKANNRKRQAQDEWKKKYIEAKKITPQLEDICSKLKLEIEKLHRTFLIEFENREKRRMVANGKPSQKTTYKIMISRLYNEIDDISRKVETAKVRLSAETKLRIQAEKEVKVLRRDLTEKKIHVTLTRSQKFNNFAPMKDTRLSAY